MGLMYFDAQPIPQVVDFIKEHYKGGTILDFGCGCGRYATLFPKDKYLGVDGYKPNVEAAKNLYPGYKFECHDLNKWSGEFDQILSSVVFDQLKKLPDMDSEYILIENEKYKDKYKVIVDEPLDGSEGTRLMLCKTHLK